MELTKEYLDEQRDCIQRNFHGYKINASDPVTLLRLNNIIGFYNIFSYGSAKTLSVGSGGFEPNFTHAGFACDVDEISYTLLKSLGWPGVFFTCSCDRIPWPDKYFSVAVCSEVIEHLPTIEIVRATFLELNRVSEHWLVSTPTRDVQEPTHKFIFTLEELQQLTAGLDAMIEQQGLFFYIHNGKRKIFS